MFLEPTPPGCSTRFFQVIPLSVNKILRLGSLIDFHSSFRYWSSHLKAIALSEYMTLLSPLLAMNLFNAKRKFCALCMALVTVQMKSAMYFYYYCTFTISAQQNGEARSLLQTGHLPSAWKALYPSKSVFSFESTVHNIYVLWVVSLGATL